MAAAEELPGPIRVLLVDVDSDLPEISGERAGGDRYRSALVFALRHGQLVGEVEVPLPGDGPLPREELAAHLATIVDNGAGSERPAVPPAELPFISVVIATTLQRLEQLDRCLTSLLALDYPTFEVILVDNRPDGSAERARLHARLCADPRVRVEPEPRPGISAARNHGARVARGEVIAFTDDDVEVHSGWLHTIGSRFAADAELDCVAGVVLPGELESPAQIWFERSGSKLPQRYRPILMQADGGWHGRRRGGLRQARFEVTATALGTDEAPHGELVYRAGTFAMGANIALRRSALSGVGWFDTSLGTGTPARGGEDIASIARLLYRGGRLLVEPASIVLHYHRADQDSLRTQMYGYGVGASAALISLIRSDPRHAVGLMYVVLPVLRALTGKAAQRRAGSYPKELSRIELRGQVAGPFAYLRSLAGQARHRVRPVPDGSAPAAAGSAPPPSPAGTRAPR